MQIRRILPLAIVGVLAAGAFVPANAAAKGFAGSYTLNLLPDPSPDAFNTAGKSNCFNLNPAAVDKHALTVPSAGKLTVVLDSPDPTGAGVTDWDLYVLDKNGDALGESAGGTSHEETTVKFKSKSPLTIVVCNLAGQPSGKVTYKLGR